MLVKNKLHISVATYLVQNTVRGHCGCLAAPSRRHRFGLDDHVGGQVTVAAGKSLHRLEMARDRFGALFREVGGVHEASLI